MQSRERNTHDAAHTRPAPSATEEYSRAISRGHRELLAVAEEALAMHAPGELSAAIESALCLATSPHALCFRRAALFLLDADGASLSGVAAARRPRTPRAQTATPEKGAGALDERLSEMLCGLRFATGAGGQNLLLRTLAGGAPRRVPRDECRSALPELFDHLAGDRPVWIVPVSAAGHPHGVLVLEEAGGCEAAWARRGRLAALLASHLGRALAQKESERGLLEAAGRIRALDDFARDLLAATNLPDVLHHAMRAAVRLTGAGCALLWLFDEQTRALEAAVHLPADKDHALDEWLPQLERLARERAAASGARLYDDLRAEQGCGLESYALPLPALAVPLHAFGEAAGVCLLAGKSAAAGKTARFDADDESLVAVLAGYAAVAVVNARLADRVRASERRLGETQAALLQSEQLAACGERAGAHAREMSASLATVSGFARRLQREMPADDVRREYLQVVLRETKRIGDLLEEQEQLASRAAPRLALRRLDDLVRAGLEAHLQDLRDRGVVIEEVYSAQIPEMLLDQERIEQMVGNLVRSAGEGLRSGDTLRIETLLQGERALLEIAHTGAALPGDALERLFSPFTSAQPSGHGLGLALAHQIIKEHGGEISVRGEEEWTTIFTITFPVAWNQERRRQGDRRKGGDRRRPPEAAAGGGRG